jgi:ATP-dependent DNA helicase RecG
MFEELFEKYELNNHHEMITEIIPKAYDVKAMKMSLSEVRNYPDKTLVTIFGYIDSYQIRPMGRRVKSISAKLYKNGEAIYLNWISSNQKADTMKYALEQQSPQGQLLQITGKVKSFQKNGVRIVSIESAKINATPKTQSNQSFIIPEPLYKLKPKMTVFKIKNAFRKYLKNIDEYKTDRYLPEELEKELDLQPLKKSLEYLHGFKPIPSDKFEDFINYPGFVKRVSAEKIWSIILDSYLNKKEQSIPSMYIGEEDINLIKHLLTKIPFELTTDQKSGIWKLLDVFSKNTGSRSLVFGDVGSGKTMVALFVSYILYKKGYQVPLIMPTSILAQQHYEEFKSFLESEDIFIIHSKTKLKDKRALNKHLDEGNPAIVLGTTSINSLNFTNIGAIFIDEEQKLGVAAKEKLFKQFDMAPHLIYMTATPIPRTLASSIFTNFHVFQIKSKPKSQKPRITKVVPRLSEEDVSAISLRMKAGEQSLVVVPSIDSDELVNVKSTTKKYSELFPDAIIDHIHGRMDKKEVDLKIETFMDGKTDLLISTTMIDSGFSNKKLSHVFIENADRFGISQLHQMRGRCGRGSLQGYCYIIPAAYGKMKDLTAQRLAFLASSEDGFKLSEYDLSLRGSGDLRGDIQAGRELNFLDWMKEIDVMKDYINRVILK